MSWIYENYGKPNRCEKCGSVRNVFWFSKSGKLKEDREDWISLCSKCLKTMRKNQKEYKVSLEELKEKRETKGKELSDIENKIANTNYDEIVKQKNKTLQENKTLEEKNYKLGVEIEKKKAELKELQDISIKKSKENKKLETQEMRKLETLKNKANKKKEEIANSETTIKAFKKEIKELSKYINEFTKEKLKLKSELNELEQELLEANKTIGKAGELQKEIENEKNAIAKREHKADVRERSLIRKYNRIGIKITNF